MALPIIKSLEDCSDFATTVSPFIHQLYELPQHLLESWNKPTELQILYLATNPLISAFAFSLFLAPIFLIVSEVNRNYSQVDRCWSILPTIYNAHFTLYAHLADLPHQRLDNLLAVSIVWSLRLTFNYWRKGGYSIGSEDYRWEIVKSKVPGVVFFIFNVVFISLAQSILLFMVSMPAYIMLLSSRLGEKSYDTSDVICARVLMGLVLIEFFADQQQWDFQKAKKAYLEVAKVPNNYKQEDLDRGFVTNGFWSWSRHPNFAAEQAVWVTVYQWSCFASGVLYNWTAVGAVSYMLLFQGSTWLTELITAGKYPDYKEYQRRVGKFLPKFGSGLPGNFSDKLAKPKVDTAGSETARAKPQRKQSSKNK